MKILMVCLGNICRSPLAEGILTHKVQALGLDWAVDSAGTSGYHAGELPDMRSIETARTHGIDITRQRSRQLLATDLDNFDKIYVMDSSNYQNVMRLATTDAQRAKIDLIMNENLPKHNIAVPDPYYGGNDGFERVYQMLDAACDAIIQKYSHS